MTRSVIVRRTVGTILLVVTLGLTNCKALFGAFSADATGTVASSGEIRHA